MEQGSVECLGGFDTLPTSSNPGWMVRVKSPFGNTHLIAVAWDTVRFKLYWFRAPYVPWENWVRFHSGNPLYGGDHPDSYAIHCGAQRGDDTRFAQVAKRTGLCPETNRSPSDEPSSEHVADGEIPSAQAKKNNVHDKKDSG